METSTTAEIIDDYQVIKVLGRGGMGEVLLAQGTSRENVGQRVAIKRPLASVAATELARFKVEGKASILEHDNIARVFKTGIQNDGRPYLAMEYVDGVELKTLIESGKQLDLLLILNVIKQVCDGLGYAHQMGFVHRDIKPGNVMIPCNAIDERGGTLQTGAAKIFAKIIDFGIAKITNTEMTTDQTQASQLIGSLYYIAPERFKAEAMDGRVDVFSTGVMLYLMLTGKLPFTGGSDTAQYRIINEAHTALGAHIRDYPPALDSIMDLALAKNPNDRFATAEDFSDALLEVIENVKKSRVSRFVDDAERLMIEERYEPALELLSEARRLDEANTQVRKLSRFIREKQAVQRRTEQVRELVAKADTLIAAENYVEGLALLKEAFRIDPGSQQLQDRIASVEAKKQIFERSSAALSDAQAADKRGDPTAALRIVDTAIPYDPDNTRLLVFRAAVANRLERERIQAQVAATLNEARSALATKDFAAVDSLLFQAESLDPANPRIEDLRREKARLIEQQERRRILDEIQRAVNDFLRADNYEKAADLLTRAIEKLPNEQSLLRLKMEVDTAARIFDSKRFVSNAIATARDAFAGDAPDKAFAILNDALGQMPGEERLIEEERSLRQQAAALRARRLLGDTLEIARRLIAAQQFDQAIAVLDSYQIDHGTQNDVSELLASARFELAAQQRRALIDRTANEARALMRGVQLDDAVRILELALKNPLGTGDPTLQGLLDDVRGQQSATIRRREGVIQRAVGHRERGEFDAGIQVLEEYLATASRTPQIQELLSSLQAQRTRKQAIDQAISAAERASQQASFPEALKSLQAVARAYGESAEIARATQQVQQARGLHAQEVVGRSIETAQAALLLNNPADALVALRPGGEMLEFADAARQAEWRRLGQEAKSLQSRPVAKPTRIVDELDKIKPKPIPKPVSPKMIGLGVAAVCVVLAGVGLVLFRPQPKPPRVDESNRPKIVEQPPVPVVVDTAATINIANAPAGALISLDGGPAGKTDASGTLNLTKLTSPHEYVVTATKDGYDPSTYKLQVHPGANPLNIAMNKVTATSGKLAMVSNLPGFKVFVNGAQRGGEFPGTNGSISLDQGTYTIHYSNEDGVETPEHKVTIVAGNSFPDKVILKPLMPKVGNLTVMTGVKNASISVTGLPPAKADGAGNLTLNSIPVGTYTVEASADQYLPASGQVPVLSGQPATLRLSLALKPPPAPTTGSLSITTTAGAQISLSGASRAKGIADSSGKLTIPNLPQGDYTVDLSLTGFQKDSEPTTISAGATASLTARLSPLPQPKTVETRIEPPPPPNPALIKAALDNYTRALMSKDRSQVQAAWINPGSELDVLTKRIFQNKEIDKITVREENCTPPEFSPDGNSATQRCDEKDIYIQNTGGAKTTFQFTFTRMGDRWVLNTRKAL